MNKKRNVEREVGPSASAPASAIPPDTPGGLADGLGVEPFSARSLVLSVLLGLTPPRLPARSLVALGELFAIAPGTMRTALSRMAAAGEVITTDAGYELAGRLLDRKTAQDTGQRPPPEEWDGTWWLAIVAEQRRDVAERRRFRAAMANARMGELRPETWLRPANLATPDVTDGVLVGRSTLDGDDPAALVARLWDVHELELRARTLGERMSIGHERLDGGDPTALVDTMRLAAAIVRFLRVDPLLPAQLRPSPWSADDLRSGYRSFNHRFGQVLRSFLDST